MWIRSGEGKSSQDMPKTPVSDMDYLPLSQNWTLICLWITVDRNGKNLVSVLYLEK
jgi:hypothetical protein